MTIGACRSSSSRARSAALVAVAGMGAAGRARQGPSRSSHRCRCDGEECFSRHYAALERELDAVRPIEIGATIVIARGVNCKTKYGRASGGVGLLVRRDRRAERGAAPGWGGTRRRWDPVRSPNDGLADGAESHEPAVGGLPSSRPTSLTDSDSGGLRASRKPSRSRPDPRRNPSSGHRQADGVSEESATRRGSSSSRARRSKQSASRLPATPTLEAIGRASGCASWRKSKSCVLTRRISLARHCRDCSTWLSRSPTCRSERTIIRVMSSRRKSDLAPRLPCETVGLRRSPSGRP